jgi:hypothetical protein
MQNPSAVIGRGTERVKVMPNQLLHVIRTRGVFVLGLSASLGLAPLAAAEDAWDKCPCFDTATIVQDCAGLSFRRFVQQTKAEGAYTLTCGPDATMANFRRFHILWKRAQGKYKVPGVYIQELPGVHEYCGSRDTSGPAGRRTILNYQHKNCLKHLRAAAEKLSITLRKKP